MQFKTLSSKQEQLSLASRWAILWCEKWSNSDSAARTEDENWTITILEMQKLLQNKVVYEGRALRVQTWWKDPQKAASAPLHAAALRLRDLVYFESEQVWIHEELRAADLETTCFHLNSWSLQQGQTECEDDNQLEQVEINFDDLARRAHSFTLDIQKAGHESRYSQESQECKSKRYLQQTERKRLVFWTAFWLVRDKHSRKLRWRL